jgi:hypothetical protein
VHLLETFIRRLRGSDDRAGRRKLLGDYYDEVESEMARLCSTHARD